MPLMTGSQYIESLKKLKPNVYFEGEKIECVVGHPLLQPHINSAALTYDADKGNWIKRFPALAAATAVRFTYSTGD